MIIRFTTARIFAVTVAVSILLLGCEEEKEPVPLPINHSEIIYDLRRIMDRGEDDVHRVQFYGKREYRNSGNTLLQHYFEYDSPDDILSLSLTFNSPVIPGDEASFIFSQLDRSNVVRSWSLAARNTTSVLVSVFEFQFVTNPNPTPMVITGTDGSTKIIRQLMWTVTPELNSPLRGLFELSENPRYLGAIMSWNVRNPIQANKIFDAQ